MNLRLPALTLVLILALALAGPVFAHAELVRSAPEANALLDRAPAQVELIFSETLDIAFSTVAVLDSSGTPVDNGDVKLDPADPTRLTVSLRSLADGVYTVSWKALSATDGHLTTGSYPFAVGQVETSALASAAQVSRQIRLSLGEVMAKWLLYLSAALLMGGTLFTLVVWQPAYRNSLIEDEPRELASGGHLTAVALTVLIIANVFGLLVQAGQASGLEVAAPWSNAVNTVLFATRYGGVWVARLALGLTLTGLLVRVTGNRARWIAVGVALLLLLTVSLGSHAAAEADPVWPVFADWMHLCAASAWVGGLVYFVAGLWSVRKSDPAFRTRLTAHLIPRFSALALTSVGVLTLSGLYAAVLRVGAWEALIQTIYGQILIVKLVIVLPMVALGAINLLIVTPNMQRAAVKERGDSSLVDRFRRILASEVTLALALLLSVGVLTSVPPARVTTAAPSLTASADADDLKMRLEITPGRVGLNTFTVTATANGQPVNNAKEVALLFTPSQADVPPSNAQLSAQGNGVYSIKGAFFSLPSAWQVQVVVRREGRFDAYANFQFDVGTSNAQSFPWNRINGVVLLVAALAYWFAVGRLSQTRAQWLGAGAVPAIVLAVIGAAVIFRPPPTEIMGLANPIPPNADSVATGSALYTANCVPCHGDLGKGDGPVGLTLNPRPADLSLHAVPGVHTDGQLYEWISHGFPGSVMPAFNKTLTDDERWHLVNFIRTLAPK